MKKSLNCRGRLLDLSTPVVMGIVNLTPDSFYDGGRIRDEDLLLSRVQLMLDEGAQIIDFGGQSTRPRSTRVDANDEWNRIEDSLAIVHHSFPNTIISVDTFYADVAAKAINSGASIINDISAGLMDKNMFSVVAEKQVPYIAMHMSGEPATMQDNPYYTNVVEEVFQYFIERITRMKQFGIHDIIIDPGFGFGKNVGHNYTLLNNLELFQAFGIPLMAGMSRKSMVTRVLNVKPEGALNGTTALHTIALIKGASILRVHDVKEAVDTIKIVMHLKKEGS